MFKKDFPYFQTSKTVYLDNGATTQNQKVLLILKLSIMSNIVQIHTEVILVMQIKQHKSLKKKEIILKEFINASKKKKLFYKRCNRIYKFYCLLLFAKKILKL